MQRQSAVLQIHPDAIVSLAGGVTNIGGYVVTEDTGANDFSSANAGRVFYFFS